LPNGANRGLLAADVVDDIELSVMPLLLGRGIPFVSPGAPPAGLTLAHVNASPTGIVNLFYEVQHAAGYRSLKLTNHR
jgi:hypothetical protein